MKADYIIRQGESLNLSLLVIEGDDSIIDNISAKLKKAGPNGSVPPLIAPDVASFVITLIDPPDIGWSLLLDDEATSLIDPGFYITNAKLDMIDGSVMKTEPVLIEIKGSVS
jgi:hypothetical protein